MEGQILMPRTNPDVDINSPGERLRQKIIKGKKLTTEIVAEMLGICRPTLSLILNNKCSITVEMCCRLETVFGEDPMEWLMIQGQYDLKKAHEEIEALNLQPFKPA